MKTMKVSELSGAALDWAVSKCEGMGIEFDDPRDPWLTRSGIAERPLYSFTPSSNWSQGGPIIEREIVSLDAENGRNRWKACAWRSDRDLQSAIGPTPLIAAMRCYVASKLGATIEVPEELR